MKINFYLSTTGIFGGSKAILEYANRLQSMGEEVFINVIAFDLRDYVKLLIKNSRKQLIQWFQNKVPIKVIYHKIPGKLKADCHIATFWKTAEFLQSVNCEGKKFYFVQGYESLWAGPQEQVEKTYTPEFEYIVLSDWLKNIIKKKTGKVALVLVTPVTPETLKASEQKIPSPRFNIGYHYVNKRFKGYQEFECAILNLEKEISNIKIKILTTERRKNFPFKEYEIWHNPPQEKLSDYYNSLDLFVSTSWYEGLGMPAMEAMKCRVPVLTTDSSGCRNYARHLDTAYIIKPNSVSEIIEGIKTLYNDFHLREKISSNGYKEVTKHNWQDATAKLINFLQYHISLNLPKV